MGRCSGFPPCCIAWYVTCWKLVCKTKYIWWYARKAGDSGYVPCPLCLMSGARVRVNKCTSECGHVSESRRLILEQHPDVQLR